MYINLEEKTNWKELKKAAQLIKQGGIAIFPTETVYGIGANGLDESAIKKLYQIKQRPLSKPISLLVNSIDMINSITENITKEEYSLIKKFMPGPLTIILKKKKIIPDILTANSDTVGIRMPENEISLKLIEYAGVPIATSSANISGQESNTKVNENLKELKEKVDVFIDGGESKISIASTVVQIVNGSPKILREGIITEKEIQKCIAEGNL